MEGGKEVLKLKDKVDITHRGKSVKLMMLKRHFLGGNLVLIMFFCFSCMVKVRTYFIIIIQGYINLLE